MAELNRNYAFGWSRARRKQRLGAPWLWATSRAFRKIAVDEFRRRSFVPNHNDLTVQNFLVSRALTLVSWEPANTLSGWWWVQTLLISLDFPVTIAHLAPLYVSPWLFSDNLVGLVTDRDAYLDVFVNQKCPFTSSALENHMRYEENWCSLHKAVRALSYYSWVHVRPFSSRDCPKRYIADHLILLWSINCRDIWPA